VWADGSPASPNELVNSRFLNNGLLGLLDCASAIWVAIKEMLLFLVITTLENRTDPAIILINTIIMITEIPCIDEIYCSYQYIKKFRECDARTRLVSKFYN
jgi:hypothetical protein